VGSRTAFLVIPAKSGNPVSSQKSWMPAFAGMTGGCVATLNTQILVAAPKFLL
jgi:hypothetical protein